MSNMEQSRSIMNEGQILAAMATATADERTVLHARLTALRSRGADTVSPEPLRAAQGSAGPERLRHSTATDWLGRTGSEKPVDELRHLAGAEAVRWLGTKSAMVRSDADELGIQAKGYATLWAGQFGAAAPAASMAFMASVAKVAEVNDPDTSEPVDEYVDYFEEDRQKRVRQEKESSRTAGYMAGVDCPMSEEGWFTDDPFTGTALCPTCGQMTPVNDGGIAYDEDTDSERRVLYPFVHLLPGKTLSDRIASRTASEDAKCSVCGKAATNYCYQEGTRASGMFACDEHVDRFRDGRTVEKVGSRRTAAAGQVEQTTDGRGQTKWIVWETANNQAGYFDSAADAAAYYADYVAGHQFTPPAPGTVSDGWTMGQPWQPSPGVARPTGSRRTAVSSDSIVSVKARDIKPGNHLVGPGGWVGPLISDVKVDGNLVTVTTFNGGRKTFSDFDTVQVVTQWDDEFGETVWNTDITASRSVGSRKTAAYDESSFLNESTQLTQEQAQYNRYAVGIWSQDQYEAYMHAWSQGKSFDSEALSWQNSEFSTPEVERLYHAIMSRITTRSSRTAAEFGLGDYAPVERWCDQQGLVMKDFPNSMIEEAAMTGDMTPLAEWLEDNEPYTSGQGIDRDFGQSESASYGWTGSLKTASTASDILAMTDDAKAINKLIFSGSGVFCHVYFDGDNIRDDYGSLTSGSGIWEVVVKDTEDLVGGRQLGRREFRCPEAKNLATVARMVAEFVESTIFAARRTGSTNADGSLQCDMRKECTEAPTMIGSDGYIYCARHGADRRASGYERVRKMSPAELKLVQSGGQISSYSSRTAKVCSECGDAIESHGDGYHHDSGTKHDHEAKPGLVRGGSKTATYTTEQKAKIMTPGSTEITRDMVGQAIAGGARVYALQDGQIISVKSQDALERSNADFYWTSDGTSSIWNTVSQASRHTASPPDQPCAWCGKPVGYLEVFPTPDDKGILCLDCYAQSAEGHRMPTADELVGMWGGPVRRGSTAAKDDGGFWWIDDSKDKDALHAGPFFSEEEANAALDSVSAPNKRVKQQSIFGSRNASSSPQPWTNDDMYKDGTDPRWGEAVKPQTTEPTQPTASRRASIGDDAAFLVALAEFMSRNGSWSPFVTPHMSPIWNEQPGADVAIEGARQGLVSSQSATQIQWTNAGIAALEAAGLSEHVGPGYRRGQDAFVQASRTAASNQVITSSDRKQLREGDRAYNYYDMEAGVIESIDSYAQPDTMKDQGAPGGPGSPMETWTNYWFDFRADDGSRTSLDGSRICSIEMAQRKGWLKTASRTAADENAQSGEGVSTLPYGVEPTEATDTIGLGWIEDEPDNEDLSYELSKDAASGLWEGL